MCMYVFVMSWHLSAQACLVSRFPLGKPNTDVSCCQNVCQPESASSHMTAKLYMSAYLQKLGFNPGTIREHNGP